MLLTKSSRNDGEIVWIRLAPHWYINCDETGIALHGKKWRYFKHELYKKHVLNGTEPYWQKGEHPTQQSYWDAFVSWKKSKEALAIIKVNTLNSHRIDNPHHTGSWGYAKKVPEWEKKLQELVQKGVTPQTVG